MTSPAQPKFPACDFQVGEDVWFPVVQPATGGVQYRRGTVHAVHEAAFAVARGNVVNVVVLRRGVLYPTHSNLLRKTLGGL